ncbi:MAG: DUF4832 domain-containing protein [Trueperaceae bacterium]
MQNTHPKVRLTKLALAALVLVALIVLLSACGAPAPSGLDQLNSTTWIKISDEKKNFTVSGTQKVRYGTDNRWVEKTVTNSGYCGNWFFGKDPADGVLKRCEVLRVNQTATPTTPVTPSAVTWTKIADETATFTVSATQTVRFGSDTRWVQKSVTGTGTCTNWFFGKDPAKGILKRCEVLGQGTATPTAAPAPAKPTTPAPTPTSPVPTPTNVGETVNVNYQKDSSNFLNPERGISNPQVSYSDKPKPLESWRLEQSKASGISVINRRYVMVSFRNSAISQSYLDHIQSDLNLVRQYGMKMIIRFSYTFNEVSTNNYADTNMDQMLRHVAQLKPILQKNADVIAFLESGFIGRWGEWNKSTNKLGDETNPQNTSEQSRLVNALLDAMPKERMITLRYYARKQAILGGTAQSSGTAYNQSKQARVGHMNDYFTIDTYSGSARNYLMQDTLWTVHGGEAIKLNGSRSGCTSTMAELTDYNWSVMNIPPGDFSNLWKQGGCYDSILRRLGYRFFLTRATLPKNVKPGSTLSVSLNMSNEGFARPYNPRGLELVLRNKSNNQVTRLAINPGQDVRAYLPGPDESKTLNLNAVVPGNLAAGNYDLFLNLPDPAASLNNRADYSVRLANSNMWDAASGYNKLGSLQVGSSSNLLANQ